ncbi:kinase-like domain-containing protein [Rhizophagus clarus]|uniref:Kinase-like domain-containing protein n=1 Tax=Rhizophagus clarus TaxID=94130 RepID=A0A8H3M7T4_9GLOM|nr:kinase-like domain-containing protein [Rhizophagus clarus]
MDGPLYKKNSQSKDYIRVSNKVVDLKLLHNSQRSIEFVINETKKFSMKNNKFLVLYGISQNPNTNDYILIHNSFISLLNWSGNKKIDDFIKEMQFRISDYDDDIVFEWIPYDQFSNINKIGIGGFATVYSTIWKDGPLVYNKDKKGYERDPNRVIALKCLDNSQNISVEFLNEVKEYSINKRSNVLNIHGISQNPDTKNYIMVLKYAEYGNFINWINVNYEKFDWYSKLTVLLNIIRGLKEIHQKNIVHRDFHTGNILILRYISNLVDNCISISDMGLCGEVDNIDKKNIYGVMPYVAPEVLRGKPYTQAADIYSFGELISSFHKSYWSILRSDDIKLQFKEAEEYRKENLSSIKNYQAASHPQAIYTSRLLNPFTKDLEEYDDNSKCLSCVITTDLSELNE